MNENKLRSWVDISLTNIAHNYGRIRSMLPASCKFLGVVKASAYGHGAVETARLLEELGADYLAVSYIGEAVELRDAGIRLPILIFGHTPPEYARQLAEMELTQTVSDTAAARAMSQLLPEGGKRLKVHVKLDTGMGRLGYRAENPDAAQMAELSALPGIDIEGIYTHFASSDEPDSDFTEHQFSLFCETVSRIEDKTGIFDAKPSKLDKTNISFQIKHCSNSAAVINYPYMHLDMVRPGLALYGIYPDPEESRYAKGLTQKTSGLQSANGLTLKPAMELRTRITHIYQADKGDTVSYGRTYTAPSRQRIAVLGIGYADGLPRILSNNMDVLIRGRRVRQVGRICMDMCMVDITHLPDCVIGDTATIFGASGAEFLPVWEQAGKSGTIPYELLCAVSPRVTKIYHR